MQPTCSIPYGSEAQKFDLGMFGARRVLSGLAFQGMRKSSTTTSSTSSPEAVGSDQGQQNPAVSLATSPACALSLIAAASSRGLSKMRNSKGSLPSQSTLAVWRISSV